MMLSALNESTYWRRERTFSEIGQNLAHYSPGEKARFSDFESPYLDEYLFVLNFETIAELVGSIAFIYIPEK